jgi:hypothetical protein
MVSEERTQPRGGKKKAKSVREKMIAKATTFFRTERSQFKIESLKVFGSKPLLLFL